MIFGRNLYVEAVRIELPAFRPVQLPDGICAVRQIAGEGQLAVHIGHADSDKRIGGQHTVRIMDVVGIV